MLFTIAIRFLTLNICIFVGPCPFHCVVLVFLFQLNFRFFAKKKKSINSSRTLPFDFSDFKHLFCIRLHFMSSIESLPNSDKFKNASEGFKGFLAQAAAAGGTKEALEALTPAEYVAMLRKNAAGLPFLWPEADATLVRVKPLERLTDSVGVVWCEPVESTSDDIVVYIHGGGFICADAAAYSRLGAQWALQTGARVAVLEFGALPENPWPLDALLEAIDTKLLQRGDVRVPAASVAVVGDSSGATLALQICRELSERATVVACCVAISPIVDVGLSQEALCYDAVASLSVAHTATAYELWRRALVEEGGLANASQDRRVSPLAWTDADCAAVVVPTWLCAGRAEALHPGVRTFVQRLPEASVTFVYGENPPQLHAWPNFFQIYPEAADTFKEACDYVKQHFNKK